MKKTLIATLKILIPFGIGALAIWFAFSKLTVKEFDQLKFSIRNANYGWVLISMVFGVLSHMSRAWRWKYLMEPLGYQPKFWNSFFSVMTGYLINMAIPRAGEVSRCGMMGRYSGFSIDKLFGTVIMERIIDMIMLLIIMATVFFTQMDVILDTFDEMKAMGNQAEDGSHVFRNIIILIVTCSSIFAVYIIKSNSKFAFKIRSKAIKIFKGIAEGLVAVSKMKNKWGFIGHTIIIWGLYVLMITICFMALPETKSVGIGGIFSTFVTGGLSIIIVPGGIGVYPIAIEKTLMFYDVPSTAGMALGWITWTSQTIMLIGVGVLSMLSISIFNKRVNKSEITK